MKRPSDQVNREERPLSKRQRTAPELFDISAVLNKKGGREYYMERFFSWRRINHRDDPDQPLTAKTDSWRAFVRLENEGKMERLLRRFGYGRTPSHDRAAPSSSRCSASDGTTDLPRSCEPRREHQAPKLDTVPTCPSPVNSLASGLCRSVDNSTASFLDYESVDPRDRQSTRPPTDDLPENQSVEVGLNARTIERLWKWKSAHRGQIEVLQQRCQTLDDRCSGLEELVAEQTSMIDELSERSAQASALEVRLEEISTAMDQLQKAEKAREAFQDRLLRSVEEAGAALEVLRREYHSRLLALEGVKEQSFDVLQRLHAEQLLQKDELVVLRDQVDRLRKIQ